MHPKKVVVTGCAGLIGSHLSRHLLDQGYAVIGVDDFSGGYEDWLPVDRNFSFRKLNLNDYNVVLRLFDEERPQATFHLAAYAAEGLSPFIRRFNYQNNILASASVINACIQYESKLIFASSMAVYGDQPPPFTEQTRILPSDPYGVAKAAIERDLIIAGEQHGLRWSVVRPHNVIGIRQNIWDRYRNVLGIFVRQSIQGQPLTIFGDGMQQRAFSHIKFLLKPLEILINDQDSEAFNLGSDLPVTVHQLASHVRSVASEFGISTSIKHEPQRHEPAFAFCNHEKAKRVLGFVDATDIADSVREVFGWALTEPSRPVTTLEYEIEKGLYPQWQ